MVFISHKWGEEIEWANLLLHFLTLGPTVLMTKRYSTRYICNKCFLYAAYLLIQPNTNPPPSPPLSPGWVGPSNGKSSIVEERLYSFFFAFLKIKNEASFFCFSSFTQLGTKTFVLLWSCKIFKRFTSLCFVFPNFWNNPIRFTFDFEKVGLIPFASLVLPKFWNNLVVFASIFRSLGTSSSFCFRSYYTSD